MRAQTCAHVHAHMHVYVCPYMSDVCIVGSGVGSDAALFDVSIARIAELEDQATTALRLLQQAPFYTEAQAQPPDTLCHVCIRWHFEWDFCWLAGFGFAWLNCFAASLRPCSPSLVYDSVAHPPPEQSFQLS